MMGASPTQLWVQGWPWGALLEGKSLGAPTVGRCRSQVQNHTARAALNGSPGSPSAGVGLLGKADGAAAMSGR